MELPEGWKRVFLEFQSPDLQFKSAYVGAKSDVVDAMNLMKEMAETLELFTEDMDISYQERILRLKKYENTFAKFKEWK